MEPFLYFGPGMTETIYQISPHNGNISLLSLGIRLMLPKVHRQIKSLGSFAFWSLGIEHYAADIFHHSVTILLWSSQFPAKWQFLTRILKTAYIVFTFLKAVNHAINDEKRWFLTNYKRITKDDFWLENWRRKNSFILRFNRL